MDADSIRSWCKRLGQWEPTDEQLNELLDQLDLGEVRRYVHVRYCDDIRHEIGGKTTLVGLYNSSMVLPSVPATVSKLCVVVTITTPIKRPFTRLHVTLQLDDVELTSAEAPVAVLDPGGRSAGDSVLMAHNFVIVLSPFQVDVPGKLRVVVDTENGRLRGNGLRIMTQEKPSEAIRPD